MNKLKRKAKAALRAIEQTPYLAQATELTSMQSILKQKCRTRKLFSRKRTSGIFQAGSGVWHLRKALGNRLKTKAFWEWENTLVGHRARFMAAYNSVVFPAKLLIAHFQIGEEVPQRQFWGDLRSTKRRGRETFAERFENCGEREGPRRFIARLAN